jgi:rhomboid family GlyGly-CTERM serine protease
MGFSKSQILSRRAPPLTLLMVASAVVVALVPSWASWLIYDRSAILSGQLWRMFTGHWVHFSSRHLVYDAIALGTASWIMEARKVQRLFWFFIFASLSINAAMLVFEPHMRFCGGLSGLATAAITLLALHGLQDPPPWRWICVAALFGVAGKILYEWVTGHCVFVTFDDAPVVVSASSHIAGAATALVWYAQSKLSLLARILKRHNSTPQSVAP